MSRVLAIIPARGGSKRIPGKNIKPFFGKPMIEYAISNCMKVKGFAEVMVSTDDEKIKEIALKAGAKVPFLRSPENSNDFAGTIEVIREVIRSYEQMGEKFSHFCCLYPATPLLSSQFLQEGLNQIQKRDSDFLVSINEFGYPVQRAMMIQDGNLQMMWPENYKKRSQDLPRSFHDAGQFYFGKTESVFKFSGLFEGKLDYVEIPREFSQDIDNLSDWVLAEQKFQLMKSAGKLS